MSQRAATLVPHAVKDLSLADEGKLRIEWSERDMPVLRAIRERFAKEKPLSGLRIGACLHVTTETANLMRTLAEGGADVRLCASNPLSTQDDAAASLARDFGISTFAVHGDDHKAYYARIRSCLEHEPMVTMDDGADLISTLHSERKELLKHVIAGTEETTTGVIRLRNMEAKGVLQFPVVAVNDADSKHLFDNRYGTGQSTVDGILRATNVLLSGRTVVVAGYGWCGRGFAMRARGMGAQVVVLEVNPLRALEAIMDGYRVLPAAEAAAIGDVFVTLTGNTSIFRREHFEVMKDGAILANSGHFNVEIDLTALGKMAKSRRRARQNVEGFAMPDGRTLFVIAEGRLVNLAAAEGHPASVMDMSFATQALSVEHLYQGSGRLEKKVYRVPEEIDRDVCRLKLASMGVAIDRLTPEQEAYLAAWDEGT